MYSNTVRMFLPPATKLGQGYIFTRVCDSVYEGGGACMTGGHVWREACMAGGCVWLGGVWQGGAWQGGACMAGGMHDTHIPHTHPPGQVIRLWHTVNERAVRILLECILVFFCAWSLSC